jgi:hypothetical protein
MQDWKGTISTLVVAAVATLLIWTWAADRTREVRSLTGTLLLRSAEPTKQFVDPAQPQPITVNFKGNPASLARLQLALEQGLVVTVPAGEAGLRSMPLDALLDSSEEVRATDASVISVRPLRLEVRTGAMVPVRMAVVPRSSLVSLLDDARIEPPEVQALVPETVAEAASRESAEALIDARNLPEGSTQQTEAPLRAPDALKLQPGQVVFTPDRVKVQFTVAGRSRSATLPTVRVEIAGAPEDLEGFDVGFPEKGDVLRDVVLTAPGGALEGVEDGSIRVVAIVHLSQEDLARRVPQKPVSAWVLPPGVSVESVSGKAPGSVSVPLKIAPRLAPEDSKPPAEGAAPAPAPAGG